MAPGEFLPGLHADLPADQYHALEAMSASGAKKMLQSPAHYKLMRDTPSEPTDAMRIGTAVHTLLLEPHRAGEIVEMPTFNSRSKDGKAERLAWLEANEGVQAFDSASIARIHAAAAAVRAHAGAGELLSDGRPEVTALWTDGTYGVPCKSRFDWLTHSGAIVDIKTTKDASPEAFRRSIGAFMYHLQAAFYWIAHESVCDKSPRFFAFIVVETEPPYGVGAYVLDDASIRAGMRHVETALRRYKEALEAGRWPAYDQTIQPISAPKWALSFEQ